MMSGEPRPILTAGSDDASNSAEANTETKDNINKNGVTEEVNAGDIDKGPGDPTTWSISNIMENLNIAEEGEDFIEPESEVCTLSLCSISCTV